MPGYFRSFPIAALLLLACGDPSSPKVPGFQTDAQKYTLKGYSGTISYTFTNPYTSTGTIPTCLGATFLSLQKEVNGNWVDSYAPFVQKCGGPIIYIGGGAQHHGTVGIYACPSGSNCFPQFAVFPIPGQYRIVWSEVLVNGAMLPVEQRTSNTFTISF